MDLRLQKLYDDAIPTYLQTNSITKTVQIHNIATRSLFSSYIKSKGIVIENYQNQIKCDEHSFSKIDNEHRAYWLGFLYADGSIAKERNRLELGLKESDKSHLEKFKEFIKCKNNISHKTNILGNSVKIAMGSKILIDDLNKLGCINCKSLILKFPTYDQVPKDYMLHFLRGYFDGDGFLGIREIYRLTDDEVILMPRCSIVSTIDFIKGFVEELNFNFRDVQLSPRGKAYTYTFNTDECWMLITSLYENANIYLDRKYEKYMNLKLYKNKCSPN